MSRAVDEWIGKTDDTAIRAKKVRICSIDGCNRIHDSHGFCMSHAKRWRVHGDPLAGKFNFKAAVNFMMQVVIPCKSEDCLKWPFGSNNKGYGVFHVKRRAVLAHVFACTAVHGERPGETHEAAHSCGKGHLLCVNPMHLRWATRSENHADKILHGTNLIGTKNPHAKLTDADVLAIRTLIGSEPQWRIAQKFGVSQMLVSKISRRQVWGWLE